ncbi:hypothetical protein JQC91_13080 [Jannaschia sp. Os4]|nr:hypothetical protein [Jannaschia sp. Os4]MBM2577235.1 hypothetical protein [Jannaschia sp. Os4]
MFETPTTRTYHAAFARAHAERGAVFRRLFTFRRAAPAAPHLPIRARFA